MSRNYANELLCFMTVCFIYNLFIHLMSLRTKQTVVDHGVRLNVTEFALYIWECFGSKKQFNKKICSFLKSYWKINLHAFFMLTMVT